MLLGFLVSILAGIPIIICTKRYRDLPNAQNYIKIFLSAFETLQAILIVDVISFYFCGLA